MLKVQVNKFEVLYGDCIKLNRDWGTDMLWYINIPLLVHWCKIVFLCPDLVRVHFYAIPILHFKFHKIFIYLSLVHYHVLTISINISGKVLLLTHSELHSNVWLVGHANKSSYKRLQELWANQLATYYRSPALWLGARIACRFSSRQHIYVRVVAQQRRQHMHCMHMQCSMVRVAQQ